MGENIELLPYSYEQTPESDSEECHEINPETPPFSSCKESVLNIKDYDFFTQLNNQENIHVKKKKTRKKEKPVKNLMDIITTELAVKPLLLENVVTFIDHSHDQRSSLTNNLIKITEKTVQRNLYENRYDQHSEIANIHPIFPRVIENVIQKNATFSTQFVEPVMFSVLNTEYADNGLAQSPKLLDVVMQDIEFVYHNTFSLERLLCEKLKELYRDYEIVEKNIIEFHRGITIYRKTRDSIREQLLSISPNKKEEIRFDRTILRYTKCMFDLKEKYIKAKEKKKLLIHKLMSLWADINMIRDKSGTIKTALVLNIRNIELEQADFEGQWAEVFEEEYSDMLIKIEYDFIIKYLEYKEGKQNFELKNRKLMKPKLQIDNDNLKNQVEALVSRMVSKNKVDIILKEDEKVSKKLSESGKPSALIYYYFKIYVDDIFVCESDKYLTKYDFSKIFFSESFSVQILQNNCFLQIVMLENGDEVSFLNIAISEIKHSMAEINFGTVSFTSKKIVEPTSKYTGSGYDIKDIAAVSRVRLKTSNLFEGKLFCSFKVNIKIGWNEILFLSRNEAIKTAFHTTNLLNRLSNGIEKPTLHLITELINKAYDKDIKEDTNIVKALKRVFNDKIECTADWCVNENMPDFVRFKLLHLRNIGKILDEENIAVPLLASQISTEQFNYLRTEDKDFDLSNFKEYDDVNAIDLQRFLGAKFIMKLNNNLMNKVNEFFLKKTFKDVVIDFQNLNLRSCFTNQSFFDLAVTSNATKQQLLNESMKKKQKIIVTVLRAYNLFDRVTSIGQENHADDNIAGYKVRPLRPFVKVSYRGECMQTPTAVGCYPTWNHTMDINAKLEPLSSIHLNIYDECRVNICESGSDQSMHSTVRYRRCNRWLGAVHVPLRTVLDVGTLRGTFKITTPPFLFGYENLSANESQALDPEIKRLIKKETSFITLNITSSLSHLGGHTYNLPIPTETQGDSVITHLNGFLKEYFNNFPNRIISLTSIDTSGANKCVIEFLQAIPVPDYDYFPKDPKKTGSALSKSSGVSKSSSSKSSKMKFGEDRESTSSGIEHWRQENQLTKIMDVVVRYVSLIPTYELTDSHSITLMGVELLKVLYGSSNDHSILLASYFMHLGIRCYVVIGFGLPRGSSSYVLVKYNQDNVVTVNEQVKRGFWGKADGYKWCVFDPVAGERFELREAGCPLKTVNYVYDYENIWVNIQSSVECENVSFDFSKSSDWEPVFGKPMFLTKPIGIESLYNSPYDVEGLRADLETKIKNKVQKWRSHVKTIWNRHCGAVLREALPAWEHWAARPARRPRPAPRLRQLARAHAMSGFPLNMPYLNAGLIAASVKHTAVHANDDPTVEFGLAVEVFPYPNNVLSVWVYLVSIVKIEDE